MERVWLDKAWLQCPCGEVFPIDSHDEAIVHIEDYCEFDYNDLVVVYDF